MTSHRPQHAAAPHPGHGTGAGAPPMDAPGTAGAAGPSGAGGAGAQDSGATARTRAGDWEPMPAATLPTRSGPIGVVGPVLAVLLILAGLVVLRDALVGYRVVRGPAWIPLGIGAADGLAPGTAFLVGGIVAALIGLWLLYVAMRRRVRSRAVVRARTGIYLAPGDIARLASAAAEDVGGVITASSKARTRTVRTTVRTTGGAGIDQAVLDAVHQRLDVLDPAPRVTVVARGPSGRSRS
ncbi:DUF6286 domain-containing protein [Georgenia thermotolerans]|uniref:DUF6286 domain-containing protein n=1 Tax=Georgenia thermotolerans TaxID=527326 RepID=A0A7J5USV4_9MICO|nr:DUF6286 domain-containing protein [Georgenia thermotolerans]KAE8765469.1 hypothetical protein GB883_03500 [Georgenia thermotolerans]